MFECLRVALTIGPLPQPCAVQACSLSTCRLHGSSPSTTKKRWMELEFKICTPSSHRPKLVIIPVMRTHSVMDNEIKKENENDISNLFSGNCADRSFQGSEQIRFCIHGRKKVSLWVHHSPLMQAQPLILCIQTQLSSFILLGVSLAQHDTELESVPAWSRKENGLRATGVHRRYEEQGP